MKGTFVFNPIPRSFSELSEPRLVEIELVPSGKWASDNNGGDSLGFTVDDLAVMERNFAKYANGAGLPITIGHPTVKPNGMREELDAVGWIKNVFIGMGASGKTVLKGLTEWTDEGLKKLQGGAFKFLSPEIVMNKTDKDTGEDIGMTLITAALTNFPFFNELSPVQFSENEDARLLIMKGGDPEMNEDQVQPTEEQETEVEENTDLEPEDAETEVEDEAENESEDETEDEAEEEAEAEASEDEGEVTLQASELAVLRAEAKAGKEAQKKLRFAEIQNDVDSLVYSEKNTDGVLKEAQREEAVKFATSLSERERKQFMTLMKGLPSLGSLFSEVGAGGDNDEPVADDVDARIKKMMAADNTLTYSQAYSKLAHEESMAKISG